MRPTVRPKSSAEPEGYAQHLKHVRAPIQHSPWIKEDRLPYELSGGEQGRVAVARAIVNQPPLLLADEPTGNLDQATGTQVLELLRELNAAGQTVIMVTHDDRAAAYASRRVDILDGQIV